MRLASRPLLFCFLVSTACAQAANVGWLSELPEGVEVHRSKAGVIDGAGWYQAVSSYGGFQVKLPVTFEDWSAAIAPDGVLAHSVGGTSPEGIVMLATQFPLIDGADAYDIKEVTQSLLADVAGVRIRYFKVRAMDASQARFKHNARAVTLRHIVVEDALFRLLIDSPLEHRRKARKIESTFFQSFRLKIEKPLAEF